MDCGGWKDGVSFHLWSGLCLLQPTWAFYQSLMMLWLSSVLHWMSFCWFVVTFHPQCCFYVGDKHRCAHSIRWVVFLLLWLALKTQKRREPVSIQSSVSAWCHPRFYPTSPNVSRNVIYSRRRRTAGKWQWRLLCLAKIVKRECKAWNSLRGSEDEGGSEMQDKRRAKAAGKSWERKRFIVLAAPDRLSPQRRSASWWKSERRSGWGILVW